MKFKLSILTLFTIISFSCYTQNDTITIKSVDSNATQYLTPMEYAFMFHEDTPWMLKGGLNSENPLFIAFERRIIGGFTADIAFRNSDSQPFLNYQNYYDFLAASISTRYYYRMNLRNKKRNMPFNLSGNYFSVGYEVNNNKTKAEKIIREGIETTVYNRGFNSTYFMRWGMQRRYLKHGFIDAGFRAAYNQNGDLKNSFQVNSETLIGLAFAKDKSSLNDKNLCSVIKCFEAERSVFKINVTDLFVFFQTSTQTNILLNPEISHEFKLGKTSFSINNTLNTSLDFYYTSNNHNGLSTPTRGFIYQPNIDRQQFLVNIGYTLETRYYFNLKNRILKGKTGNGLSADYISFGFYNYYQNNDFIRNTSSVLRDGDSFNFLQPQLSIGTQRFIGDRFFYDIGAGIRFTDLIDQVSPGNNRSAAKFLLRSNVGFRF